MRLHIIVVVVRREDVHEDAPAVATCVDSADSRNRVQRTDPDGVNFSQTRKTEFTHEDDHSGIALEFRLRISRHAVRLFEPGAESVSVVGKSIVASHTTASDIGYELHSVTGVVQQSNLVVLRISNEHTGARIDHPILSVRGETFGRI